MGLFAVDVLQFPAFSVIYLIIFDALGAPAHVFILQGFCLFYLKCCKFPRISATKNGDVLSASTTQICINCINVKMMLISLTKIKIIPGGYVSARIKAVSK